MKLFYHQKAEKWTEALPIANGHIGAVCYGGEEGRFDLSENTCWSGEIQAAMEPSAGQRKKRL